MKDKIVIIKSPTTLIGTCGDANPKGNVLLTYKGSCGKDLDFAEAYRCTGCGGWFHKTCIFEHFKLEKEHDWGRNEERKYWQSMQNSPNISKSMQEKIEELIGHLGQNNPKTNGRWVDTNKVAKQILALFKQEMLFIKNI